MPVPAQNSCLREFVARKNGIYVLPVLESDFDNCYHQLFQQAIIAKADAFILMYSALMLPPEQKLGRLLSLLEEKKIGLAFVLENLIGEATSSLITEATSSYKLRQLALDLEAFRERYGQLTN